jgi:hypothetical protein
MHLRARRYLWSRLNLSDNNRLRLAQISHRCVITVGLWFHCRSWQRALRWTGRLPGHNRRSTLIERPSCVICLLPALGLLWLQPA